MVPSFESTAFTVLPSSYTTVQSAPSSGCYRATNFLTPPVPGRRFFRLRLESDLMEDSYTIKISNNFVDKLVGEENKKKKIKKPKPKSVKEPQKLHDHEQPAHSPINSSSVGWALQPSIFLPMTAALPPVAANPELEAISSVLGDSEGVLERLKKQESNMHQERTQRAKELREKEFKLPYQNPLPCASERASCLRCYKEHSRDSLKCAEFVKNFADCARLARKLNSFGSS